MNPPRAPNDAEPAIARRLHGGIVFISRASRLVMSPSITAVAREILDALRVRACSPPPSNYRPLAEVEASSADSIKHALWTTASGRDRTVPLGSVRILRPFHRSITS